jgi:asparagine synthetase B (glutamine-hydrolysing)
MVAALRHRGPDGEGILIRGDTGLAHTRLSIVGLADGAQPRTMRLRFPSTAKSSTMSNCATT